MKRTTRLVLLGGMFLVCTGCVEGATVQQHVTIGEDEIIARWGAPTDRHAFDDHSQKLTWAYQGCWRNRPH